MPSPLDPSATASAVTTMLTDLSDSLGNESVIAIVDVFRDVSAKQIHAIELATHNKDLATLKREAHSLKSSAANLGAQSLSDLCAKLEKAESLADPVPEMVQNAKLLQTLSVEAMMNWKSGR